ncbi:tellurite resistance TerB family protein [Methylomonas sp. MED-D]|uniref:tellurite resistance TerB family protein n=1 Tax=Methylomonas sp. MED-D TaxID=3418768 RepID=UPI003D082D3E
MFGKLFKTAKAVHHQNLMEAIVAGSMLVAAADGTVEKSELDKLDKLLTSNENLSAFKPGDIRKVISRYQNVLEADFGVGQQKMMKELADISDNPDHCEEVFLNMLAIAKSDGEIEPGEKAVLTKVARSLGISLDEYGLAA